VQRGSGAGQLDLPMTASAALLYYYDDIKKTGAAAWRQ